MRRLVPGDIQLTPPKSEGQPPAEWPQGLASWGNRTSRSRFLRAQPPLFVHSLILYLTGPGSAEDDEDEDQWRRRSRRNGTSSVLGVGGLCWC